MSIARDLFDLRTAGLYLPSLVLLTIEPKVPWLSSLVTGIPWIHLLAFFSLLGAVYFHGLSRNVFGIGGPEENPMETSKAIQGAQVALTGKGPHQKHPDDIVGLVISLILNKPGYGIRRRVFMLGFVFTIGMWFPSALLSVYAGVTQFGSMDIPVKFLIFAEFVWIMQWRVWGTYTPAYLLEESDFS